MQIKDLERVVAAGESRLKARLQQLVELESPSEDKAAVDRAAKLVADWSQAIGGRVKLHPRDHFGDLLEVHFGPEPTGAQPTSPELIRTADRSSHGPRPVLLLGHLDTVWPIGTLATMPWTETDGRLCGPGVVDMKAGVVMALEAVAALQHTGQHRPVTLLLVSDEEVGSPASRQLTEDIARQSEAVFVLEPAQELQPAGFAYKTARKGVGHFELRVTGVASHAGVDFASGHSAIREMARLIERVSACTDLTRGLTVNVGVVRGGTRSNVVAAECIAEVDVRIASAADAAHVEQIFQQLSVFDQGCTLAVTGGINRPPMERTGATVRLFRQAQALAAEMGWALEEAATGGGSDGNFTSALGVPTLDGMGAAGGGAHAAHEHVLAAHLVPRTTLLAGMIAAVQS